MKHVSILVLLAGCGGSKDGAADSATDAPAPQEPLPAELVLEGDDLFPDGVAFDPVDRAFYVGSLEHGSLHRIDADGAQSTVLPGEEGWSTVGLAVDVDGRLLYACATFDGVGEVWRVALDDGTRLDRIPLDHDGEGSCNDVTVGPDGAVYVSDSQHPWIHHIAPGADVATGWSTDPRFSSMIVGLNGLVVAEERLIIGHYTSSLLFSIPLDDPTDITEVTFTAGALDASGGVDGLALLDDGRVAVTFDDALRVVAFADADLTEATATPAGSGAGWTTAAHAEGRIYVVNGQASAHIFGARPQLPFKIVEVAVP